MSGYVHPTEQLVTEIVVRDIRRSVDFYERLGFTLLGDGGDFVELTWEDHRLYLAELSAYHLDSGTELPLPPAFPLANVRVMVPDVDQCWRRANDLGARIITGIDDRYYGLRDFIIADPDGFGVRFASRLQTPKLAQHGHDSEGQFAVMCARHPELLDSHAMRKCRNVHASSAAAESAISMAPGPWSGDSGWTGSTANKRGVGES